MRYGLAKMAATSNPRPNDPLNPLRWAVLLMRSKPRGSMRSLMPALALAICLAGCQFKDASDSSREAELTAIQSASHPFAGFWKDGHCIDDFGLAIAPAGDKLYSVSFCGPGGCFEPGTYRPNTALVNDPEYRVLDKDTIEVSGSDGFARYIRCPARSGA